VANWYASTFYDGEDYASILVKTREGRPIHIKGNPRFGINHNPKVGKGSINARINSSVLSLYDNERLKAPMTRSTDGLATSTWADADKAIATQLERRRPRANASWSSPTRSSALAPSHHCCPAQQVWYPDDRCRGQTAVGGVEHVQYDTISYSGVTNANLKSFGKRVMPSYDLTKADVVVSVDADFLSSWGSTTEHTWQYANRRDPKGAMNKHFQFESRMSLSGANADVRVPMKPSELPLAVISLHDHIAKKMQGGGGRQQCHQATRTPRCCSGSPDGGPWQEPGPLRQQQRRCAGAGEQHQQHAGQLRKHDRPRRSYHLQAR
jgi:hypothetical protein